MKTKYQKFDFNSYKVYEVTPKKHQVPYLREWEDHSEIDFWSSLRAEHPAKIMVDPKIETAFLEFLDDFSIAHELTIPDVEVMLRKEKEEHNLRRKKRSLSVKAVEDATFDHFWTFDEMEAYARLVAQTYPDHVQFDIIGKTIENRNMFGLKISNNLSNFGLKPIIFIDAGTHAR